jgi:hypothetical protein
MTFLLSNGQKLFLPKKLRKKPKFEPLHPRTDEVRSRLAQVPEQQVQHAGQARSAESRHMLDNINRPSQEMPGGESNQHAAEDPEHQ